MSTTPRLFHPKSPLHCDALCRDIVHPFLPFCSLAGLCACSLHLLTCARGLAATGSPLPRRCSLCGRGLHTLCRLILWEVVPCGRRRHLSRPGVLYPAPRVVFSFTPSPSRSLWLLLSSPHMLFLPLRLCLPALLSVRTLPSEFICQCHVTITTVNQPKSHLQRGSCFRLQLHTGHIRLHVSQVWPRNVTGAEPIWPLGPASPLPSLISGVSTQTHSLCI